MDASGETSLEGKNVPAHAYEAKFLAPVLAASLKADPKLQRKAVLELLKPFVHTVPTRDFAGKVLRKQKDVEETPDTPDEDAAKVPAIVALFNGAGHFASYTTIGPDEMKAVSSKVHGRGMTRGLTHEPQLIFEAHSFLV